MNSIGCNALCPSDFVYPQGSDQFAIIRYLIYPCSFDRHIFHDMVKCFLFMIGKGGPADRMVSIVSTKTGDGGPINTAESNGIRRILHISFMVIFLNH
jgi:hypothetical protein